jgi:hypothetical protein
LINPKKMVVFLSHSMLTERISRSYAVDRMVDAFDFQYWDIGKMFRPTYDDNSIVTADYIRTIDFFPELDKLLEGLDEKTVLVTDIPRNFAFRSLFLLLNKYNFQLVHLDLVTTGPVGAAKKSLRSRFLNMLLDPLRYLILATRLLKMKYLVGMGIMKDYDYRFYRGGKCFAESQGLTNQGIAINSPDYDSFISETPQSAQLGLVEEQYAVFLDVYLPFHPDMQVMGLPSIKNPIQYFNEMNALFSAIEDKYQLKVIVAAHPSANYSGSEFGGRKIMYGSTKSLIRDCRLVVSHHSNSLAFAILYNKPNIFCYTDEMYKLYSNSLLHHQNCYATYLGVSTYNISELLKKELPDVSHWNANEHYQSFVYDFLTSGSSKDRVSSDIIISFIESL